MRHLLLVGLIGCGGGGGGGEPIMGTVTLDYGDDRPALEVGAAVQHRELPDRMLVQIGTDSIDCDTYLEDPDARLPSGTFILFDVPKTPATTNEGVAVLKVTSRSLSYNSGPGSVTIDAVDPRITGTVTFATTDNEVGSIMVAGTFDVIRCF